MSIDLPDYTLPISLQAIDVDVLPIDINIENASAGVTFNVNIASQSLDWVDVNIRAAVATVSINIKAQQVGVYLQPEWAAKEGEDVNLSAASTISGGGQEDLIDYTVPSGKNLMINDVSVFRFDESGPAHAELRDLTAGVSLAFLGGELGCVMVFSKPKRIPSGHRIVVRVTNQSASGALYAASLGGYLI